MISEMMYSSFNESHAEVINGDIDKGGYKTRRKGVFEPTIQA